MKIRFVSALVVFIALAFVSAAVAQEPTGTLVVRAFSEMGGQPAQPEVRVSPVEWGNRIGKGRIYTCADVHSDWQFNCFNSGEFVLQVADGEYNVEVSAREHFKSYPQRATFDAYNQYRELNFTLVRGDVRILNFRSYNYYGYVVVAYELRNDGWNTQTVTIDTEVNGSAVTAFDAKIAGDGTKSTGRLRPGQTLWVYRYYRLPASVDYLPYGTHFEVRSTVTLGGDTALVLAQDSAEVPAQWWFQYWYGVGEKG